MNTLAEGWVKVRRDGVVTPEFNPELAELLREMNRLDRLVLADCIEDRRPDLAAQLREKGS